MAKYRVKRIDKAVPDAYHGTELAVAQRIAAGNEFRPSRGPDSWLGDGVYFYEASKALAEWWAKRAARKRNYQEYGVLKARVLLGKCLDLTEEENFNKLQFWADQWKKKTRKRLTEAWVINSFAKKCEGGFDTVRCRFGSPLGENRLFESSKIQKMCIILCVKAIGNISDVELVKKGSAK